jgi:hypothetical protein
VCVCVCTINNNVIRHLMLSDVYTISLSLLVKLFLIFFFGSHVNRGPLANFNSPSFFFYHTDKTGTGNFKSDRLFTIWIFVCYFVFVLWTGRQNISIRRGAIPLVLF